MVDMTIKLCLSPNPIIKTKCHVCKQQHMCSHQVCNSNVGLAPKIRLSTWMVIPIHIYPVIMQKYFPFIMYCEVCFQVNCLQTCEHMSAHWACHERFGPPPTFDPPSPNILKYLDPLDRNMARARARARAREKHISWVALKYFIWGIKYFGGPNIP